MRFTEKLNATLKKAYELYAINESRQYCDLKELMNSANIIADHEEVVNVGKRLEGDGLVIFYLKYGKSGTPHIYLTSDGIALCESGTLFELDLPVVKTNEVETEAQTSSTDRSSLPGNDQNENESEQPVTDDLAKVVVDEPLSKPQSLLQLLQEIKVAATLSEDLRVREIKELLERIEELTVFLNAEQRIPKYGFNDFFLLFHHMEPMSLFMPKLNAYLP
jgi:hypothetical protein